MAYRVSGEVLDSVLTEIQLYHARRSKYGLGRTRQRGLRDEELEEAILLHPSDNFPSFKLDPQLPSTWTRHEHLRESLRDLPSFFPELEPQVVNQVITFTLKPEDIYKLDFKLVADAGGLDALGGNPETDYPTFDAIFVPLSLYFRVLQKAAAVCERYIEAYQIGFGGLKYLEQLQGLQEEYSWDAVRSYHFDYHRARIYDMVHRNYATWGTINQSLVDKHCIQANKKIKID